MAQAACRLDQPLEALQAVLDATEAVARTLDPLDLDAFEQALAVRSEALRRLEAAAQDHHGTPPPWADTRAAALRELSLAVTRADAQARDRAAEILDGLRKELKGVAAAQTGLEGYRPATPNAPRFADCKG